MDLHMPICDGFEATRRLHTDPVTAEIPVIALTATEDPDEVQAALAAGCVGHLSKPMEAAKLVRLLEGWIRARRMPVAV